jgi:hypothetical protein
MVIRKEKFNRRRDLVLTTVAYGRSVDVLENLEAERITADIREIRRWVVRLLDNCRERTVIGYREDAVRSGVDNLGGRDRRSLGIGECTRK